MSHNCIKCLDWYSDSHHEDMGYEEGTDGLCCSCWSIKMNEEWNNNNKENK